MQDKYTKSAEGQECQIRIPGYCNFNPETTIFAHINGAGMGFKHHNIHGAYACSNCHDVVDGRRKHNEFTNDEVELMFLQGVVRTQIIMIEIGIIKI